MPGGGGEDEDAEGAAELPEATASEVPQEPQEPRSPQQVGPQLRPAKLKPSAGQASPHLHGIGSPVGFAPRPVGLCFFPLGLAHQGCRCILQTAFLFLSRTASAPQKGAGVQGSEPCGVHGYHLAWQLVSKADPLAGGDGLWRLLLLPSTPKGQLCVSAWS